LSQVIPIDLVGLEEEAAKNTLLAEIRRTRSKPVTPPAFPGELSRPATEGPRFPGALPQIWNVPNQNHNFTGREEYLATLRRQLTSGHHAVLTQAISGLGGVGKTQLGIEYSYRYASNYDAVWWIRAEEPLTLAEDYARLAWKLGLQEKDEADQKIIIEAVRARLGRSANWLLIFDNARSRTDIIDYLPQGGGGHVIITSRNPNWRGVAASLSLAVMPVSEGVDFISKRTGQTDSSAAPLVKALGGLPLALEQAGAYMEATGKSIVDYLKLFQTHQQELLRRGKPSTDYPATVATTWNLSFEQVREKCPAGGELLNLCAFLAPDDIPRGLFSEGAAQLPGPLVAAADNPFILDEAVEALKEYSLINAGSDTLSVHRLVQAVTRDQLTAEDRTHFVRAALLIIHSAFPVESDDVRTWPKCKILLPHALSVTEHCRTLQLTIGEAGNLYNRAGLYLSGRAEYAEAKAAFIDAWEISTLVYGSDDPAVAESLNNLGNLLETLGALEGAQDMYERALKINETKFGNYHPAVASNLNNLGNVFKKLADQTGLVPLLDKTLIVRVDGLKRVLLELGAQGELGPHAPKVLIDPADAEALSTLPYPMLQTVEMLKAARENHERALNINNTIYGPNHPAVASNLNNLGHVLTALCELEPALSCFERALTITEATYGVSHPMVASVVNSLGSILKRQGNVVGAREKYERALSIDELFYGPNHPVVALRLNNVGYVLQELGDIPEAQERYERALSIFRESLGDNHPFTKTVQENLDLLSKFS
jgi:tetratricopeptide (TPR) repeat protein